MFVDACGAVSDCCAADMTRGIARPPINILVALVAISAFDLACKRVGIQWRHIDRHKAICMNARADLLFFALINLLELISASMGVLLRPTGVDQGLFAFERS